jgi:hypothetical protein
MPENEIIAEIHRYREEVSRQCGFDLTTLMAHYRQRELERKDEGHPLVTFAPSGTESAVVREEPRPEGLP